MLNLGSEGRHPFTPLFGARFAGSKANAVNVYSPMRQGDRVVVA
jgi:hypothetical protein